MGIARDLAVSVIFFERSGPSARDFWRKSRAKRVAGSRESSRASSWGAADGLSGSSAGVSSESTVSWMRKARGGGSWRRLDLRGMKKAAGGVFGIGEQERDGACGGGEGKGADGAAEGELVNGIGGEGFGEAGGQKDGGVGGLGEVYEGLELGGGGSEREDGGDGVDDDEIDGGEAVDDALEIIGERGYRNTSMGVGRGGCS